MEVTTKQSINAMRVLAVEAVERANSGHPGLPLGASPMMYELMANHMNHNPKNPNYFNRDRFVLSAGHGSSLLYSALHLFNYGLTKEDLMSFRQLKSRTPGHPEYKVTAGVEVSTGPLGQGFANAVGFAMAESMMAEKYNKEDIALVDHYTYVMCGDGCMQEGIQYEAASLAGTLGLGKLICLYDSNAITIEGSTDLAFTENVAKSHEAMGWHVINVTDGEDIEEIGSAITLAKKELSKPSLIIVKTTIGFGSPKAGSADCHGAPLGEKALAETKKAFNWTAKPFEVPSDVTAHYSKIVDGLAKCETEWAKTCKQYKAKYSAEYEQFQSEIKGKLPEIAEESDMWQFDKKDIATRGACDSVLNKLADKMPNLVGGSADLGPSNKTVMKGKGEYSVSNKSGRNIHFGIREHAMGAICNGLALHGGIVPYCSTFLSFSDYMKNAIRMSCLMNLNVTYIFSHDSIGVGEDGPTHQPVEHIVNLRSIPNIKLFRPADALETTVAFANSVNGKGTSCIITSRQDLPYLDCTSLEANKGGYVVKDSTKEVPDCILMASGSEVSLALNSAKELLSQGIDARVVSMPCMEIFEAQSSKYKDSVLLPSVRSRIAIEAGSSLSWHRFVGLDGACVTMDKFGDSAPADLLFNIFGFTVDNVVNVTKKVLKTNKVKY